MDEQPLDRAALRRELTTGPHRPNFHAYCGGIALALLDLLEQTERELNNRPQPFPEPPVLMNMYLNMEKERDAARRELAKARWIVQLKDMTAERLEAQVARLTEERDKLAIDDRGKYETSTTRWRGNPVPQRAIEATAAVPVVPDEGNAR